MYSNLQHDSFQRLHDAARREAGALRREAINDFWRQLGQAIRRGLQLVVPGKGGARAQAK